MPRYVIESPGALHVPVDDPATRSCGVSLPNHLSEKVTWLHSYVSLDKSRTFCVCDGPTSEAIRREADRKRLPIARLTEVRLLDA
jgi:hypothetical protein